MVSSEISFGGGTSPPCRLIDEPLNMVMLWREFEADWTVARKDFHGRHFNHQLGFCQIVVATKKTRDWRREKTI